MCWCAGVRVGLGARSPMKSGVSSFPEKSADDGNLTNLRGRDWWRWKVEVVESGGKGL